GFFPQDAGRIRFRFSPIGEVIDFGIERSFSREPYDLVKTDALLPEIYENSQAALHAPYRRSQNQRMIIKRLGRHPGSKKAVLLCPLKDKKPLFHRDLGHFPALLSRLAKPPFLG